MKRRLIVKRLLQSFSIKVLANWVLANTKRLDRRIPLKQNGAELRLVGSDHSTVDPGFRDSGVILAATFLLESPTTDPQFPAGT